MPLEGSRRCLFFPERVFVCKEGETLLKIDFRAVLEHFIQCIGSVFSEDVFFELGILPEFFRLRFSKIFGRGVWGFGGLYIFD
jgi:hypothetical protein